VTGKRPSLRRRVLLLGALGALATLVLCAIFHRPIISHVVTVLAFGDAERLAAEADGFLDEQQFSDMLERAMESVASRYGYFFSRGFLSRTEVASRIPASGLKRETVPAIIVIGAFYEANAERLEAARLESEIALVAGEFAEWLEPVASLPGPKELLVNVFVTSSTYSPGSDRGDGIMKRALFSYLFCEDKLERELIDCMSGEEISPWKQHLLGLVRPEHWASVIRHTEHPREKVRAGSLLLLNRHPSEQLIVERARAALDDPSEWVRLAGAGLLAIRRIDEGEQVLLERLGHVRWEVRFWCVFGLFALGKPGLREVLDARLAVEKDDWLEGVLRDAIRKLGEEPR
jgi:hypothetical protein